MVERGGGAGFVFEAGQLLLVEHGGERQHLQGDAAAEGDLLGFVDDAHAAAADLAEDAEVAEAGAIASQSTAGRASSGTRGRLSGRLVGQLRCDVLHEVQVAEAFGQLVGNIGVFGQQDVAVVRLSGGHRVHHFFHRRHETCLGSASVARWMGRRSSADATA